MFNDRFVKPDMLVSADVKDKPLEEVLDQLLTPQQLTYYIEGKTIAISHIDRPRSPKKEETVSGNVAIATQQGQVTGKVTDQAGNALAGVTVSIKESLVITLTDESGNYQITLPNQTNILVFSMLGFQSVQRTITEPSTVNVTLQPSVSDLDEVVVVGYGETSRAKLTTAQTSINSEQINQTVNTTLEQAIQGRASGVYITHNTGQPGGGISVNIRGINTINGSNEPLYVIDGIQMQGESVTFGEQSSANPLAGLNPSDIEDIQILKGASAAAIYGSRATNGVVLITTKRGKSGTMRVGYTYSHSIQTTPEPRKVLNLQQYATVSNEYHAMIGDSGVPEFRNPALLGEGTDWQEALFRNAIMGKHQLNLSGGNDNTTYYLSGEYLDQGGIAEGSGFERYGTRLNLDNKPRKWLALGANLSFSQTDESLTTSSQSLVNTALRLSPQIPVKNLDGSWGGGDDINGANINAPVNPVAIANLIENSYVRRQFLGGVNLRVDILKGLQFRTDFNANYEYTNALYYIPEYKIGWAANDIASLKESNRLSNYWRWNQLLEYKREFGKHNVLLMASHEAQGSARRNLEGRRTGFLTDDIRDLQGGDPLTASNKGGSSEWAMESYLGRLNYDYDDKYLLSATVRRDGSVNFGDNNKWGTFPSASAAWRVAQEDFFNVPFISELKLRAEVGLTGNQGWGTYIYAPMAPVATPTGTGFLASRYNNPDLKWEETFVKNIGLNVGLFQNKVEVEFDAFIKNTDNLLMINLLPWYLGTNGTGSVGAPMVNIGALENKGLELSIRTTNIETDRFTWKTNFNVSTFRTKIERFYSETAFLNRISTWMDNWTQRAAVGETPWLFRGYMEDGLFQSVDEINASAVPVDNNGNRLPVGEDGLWVGDVKFKDVSGPDGVPDGMINEYDETNIGNPFPKWFGGLTNTFSYKGFDMSILLTGAFGNDVYNYIAKRNSNPNNIYVSQNFLIDAMDYAKPIIGDGGKVVLEDPNAAVPRITLDKNGNNHSRHTDRWVEDGSFVRIKNITLGYNLPTRWLSKQKIVSGIRITGSAQNIYTFTKYTGYDPEVGAYIDYAASAQNQAIGIDYGRYPLTPVYTFSIGVNF
ncbi:TonB-dependent receptor [Sphingobacterium sp. SGG-5]|nr:TonB-dependent receptor [Sphingobacterium sp. SGG-5]